MSAKQQLHALSAVVSLPRVLIVDLGSYCPGTLMQLLIQLNSVASWQGIVSLTAGMRFVVKCHTIAVHVVTMIQAQI